MAPMVRWAKDKKGSIVVQTVLYIGIFVLILFMSFQIWKVISIKQSLKGASYQAARYISLNGLKWILAGREGFLKNQIQQFIETELHNNSFVPADSHPIVDIWSDIHYFNWCEGSTFKLSVKLEYTVPIPRLGAAEADYEKLTFSQNIKGPFKCLPE